MTDIFLISLHVVALLVALRMYRTYKQLPFAVVYWMGIMGLVSFVGIRLFMILEHGGFTVITSGVKQAWFFYDWFNSMFYLLVFVLLKRLCSK